MSEPRSRSQVVGALAAGGLVVFFCLLLLWHDPLLFWNDDYELSILPVFADVARSWSEGHLPLLSPYSWVCSNLAGEFQYGTFSIFVNTAVVLIWKFPLTFAQQAAALSVTHLFVLAAGAFLLARDRLRLHEITETPSPQSSQHSAQSRSRGGRRSRLVRELTSDSFALSIFVALVAALNGWIICWGATDWFGALGAFAWLPWAWWGLERALDRERGRWRFLWPAPFIYLLVTGGFPYTVLMLALLIAWLLIKSLVQMWERTQRRDSAGPARTRDTKVLSTLPMIGGAALGVGMSAPAWLAILDYVHGSARGVEAASAHWQWIVPLSALPGLILPSWTVKWADFSTRLMPHTATELVCGLVAPVALIAGLVARGRVLIRQIRWELLLLLLVLLLCMLPTAGVFRWSFRWLPFFHLILALCAAEALKNFSAKNPLGICAPPAVRTPGLIGFGLVALIAITMSILRTSGEYAFPLTWIFLALAALWALSEFFVSNQSIRTWTPACLTFAAFLATYLCIPPNCGVPKYNLSQELTKSAPLDPQRLYLSIYPPVEYTYRMEKKPWPVGRIVRPGSTPMWAGLRFINGYSPIRPAGVARAFKVAIHGEIDSDTGRDLLEHQAGPEGDLAKLGVDAITIAQEIDVDPQPPSEWELAIVTREGRVFYRKGTALPIVRSITSIRSRPNEEFVPAAISWIEDSRNRVEADVDVPSGGPPALLSFSRPYFRGYEAHLDGRKLLVDFHRGLFPVVQVPAGSSGRIVLSYRPAWLVYGGGLSILCAVFFFFGVCIASRGKARRASENSPAF
jgi:hypothetical protein